VNYCPVTNLNSIGKILDRLGQKQLRKYVRVAYNYGTFQSAYRALHSTETAMTKVVNDLLMATGSVHPAVLLALDISAAFDTLDHDRIPQRANLDSVYTTG